jgi:hypothetical protein
VRRITLLQKGKSGDVSAVVVYKRADKKKKSTTVLRPVEQLVHRIADAQVASAQSYLARHERSNTKEKDGWVWDLPSNVFKASRKGTKKLRLTEPLSFDADDDRDDRG